MKKFILVVIVSFCLNYVQAQVQPVSEKLVSVKDTSFRSDPRFQSSIVMYQSLVESVNNFNSQAKANNQNVEFDKETEKLVNEISKSVSEYALNFREIKDVKVDPGTIEKEFNELNEKLNSLSNDQNIKLSDFKKESATIRARQAKLVSYYNQINKK